MACIVADLMKTAHLVVDLLPLRDDLSAPVEWLDNGSSSLTAYERSKKSMAPTTRRKQHTCITKPQEGMTNNMEELRPMRARSERRRTIRRRPKAESAAGEQELSMLASAREKSENLDSKFDGEAHDMESRHVEADISFGSSRMSGSSTPRRARSSLHMRRTKSMGIRRNRSRRSKTLDVKHVDLSRDVDSDDESHERCDTRCSSAASIAIGKSESRGSKLDGEVHDMESGHVEEGTSLGSSGTSGSLFWVRSSVQ